MNILEEHLSPDRLLRLAVIRENDGDTSIGFVGMQWHTHGDILAQQSGRLEAEAIREFIDCILSDGQVLAVSRLAGEVRDVWPTDNPLDELRYKEENESIEFRRWSGEQIKVN